MTKLLRLFAFLLALGLLTVVAAVPSSAQQQLAENDWERVQATGALVFGTAADYPPFAFYDSNFQLDGFDIALARELGKRLGVEVAFNDFAFSGLLDSLQLGAFDAAIAAISVTPDRQEVVDFTNLYFVGEDAALVRSNDTADIRSATDFTGKRVGVEVGTTYQIWAQQNLVDAGIIPQENLTGYADVSNMIRDLRNGTIDVVLLGRLVAIISSNRVSDLRIAGEGLTQQRYAIALRKGSTLTEKLNEALAAIQADGTYLRLAAQYLNISPDGEMADPESAIVENTPVEEGVAPKTECLFGMAYVADLNLDDRNMTAPAILQPGQDFVKSWRVRNSGACEWTANFALVYVSGNRVEASMGALPLIIGRTVAPGATIDLSVTLQAPTVYGTFQGFWQMRDDTGRLFGEVVWVGIQVLNPNPPTPVPVPATPTPAPPTGLNPNLRADSTWINVGQCTALRWDIDNIQAIFLVDGSNVQGVGGHDSRSVCPQQTTTYLLRVVRTDGGVEEFPIVINVSGQAPARPGPSISRFTVDHNAVGSGQCVNFSWQTNNADGVNLYRSNNRIVSNGGREGSRRDCPPDGNWDYRLEAFGNGNVSQTIHVSASGRSRDE